MPDEPVRHLHDRHLQPVRVINEQGELLPEGCPNCEALEITVVQLQASAKGNALQIGRLKREISDIRLAEPEHRDILEVLEFWKRILKPQARLTVNSERWAKVRARLRDQDALTKQACYSVLQLKAAVVGCTLSAFHMREGYTDAKTIFKDAGTTDDHIARAVGFKRRYGSSALVLVEELGSKALAWLAELCSCGHTWLEHLRSGTAAQGGAQECSVCECEMFDTFHAKQERWLREQQR